MCPKRLKLLQINFKKYFLAEILHSEKVKQPCNNLCVMEKCILYDSHLFGQPLTFINKPLLSSNAACKLQNDQKFTFLIQNNNFMTDKEIKMMK